jgi:Uma2 family endonuclease
VGEKAALYAQAGIRDYWVIDANHRRVVVFRDPGTGRYRSQETLAAGAEIHPLAFAAISLDVAPLFAGL